jgi:hypothetical protein
MSKIETLSTSEIEQLDRFYRAGGLKNMASPHIHYDDPNCPHAGCTHKMEWIDFRVELHGDPEGVYRPLVRSWWEGKGFAGRCPGCGRWVHFTTLRMTAISDEEATHLPRLPDSWHSVAQFA